LKEFIYSSSLVLSLFLSVKDLERPQMSDFSDGCNRDAIITTLITTRTRKWKGEKKREGRKK